MKKNVAHLFWVVPLLIVSSLMQPLWAQTCCSGGVPISGNLGMPVSNPGTVQISINYDFNHLSSLYDGQERLADDTRERNTHSILAEIGYQFSPKWSVSTLFTAVRQERNLSPIGLPPRDQSTAGVGDAVILLRYQPINMLTLGVGVKAPLGQFRLIDERGIQYNADLQPGSGAWDGIGWLQVALPWQLRPSGAWSATAITRLTGTNPEFRSGQSYQFGNDLQVIGGYTDRVYLLNQIVDLSAMARYRWAGFDQTNGTEIPNTGGSWVFINPGITWWPIPSLSWQVNGEVPIFSQVEGIQLSPTWRINTGIYVLIGNRNKNQLEYEGIEVGTSR